MAEEDAEIALLHQLQAGQENGTWADDDAKGAVEGEPPSITEHNNQQEVKRENVADDQVLRALSPSGAGAIPSGGDHDPSVILLPAITIAEQEGSRSSSRASTRKPKTVGGFIADDSDEEYDTSTPQPSTNLQVQASNTPNRAISPSPLQNSVSQQDVPSTSVNQGDSEMMQESSELSVNPSSAAVSSVQAPATQVLTSAGLPAQVISLPKARLPQDKIGILEDRVKGDPRGDMDAWLELIKEHRKRNKLDEARGVYERFFKVFPQCVSSTENDLTGCAN
jgi:cleavage stimulation factor subunit 3